MNVNGKLLLTSLSHAGVRVVGAGSTSRRLLRTGPDNSRTWQPRSTEKKRAGRLLCRRHDDPQQTPHEGLKKCRGGGSSAPYLVKLVVAPALAFNRATTKLSTPATNAGDAMAVPHTSQNDLQ